MFWTVFSNLFKLRVESSGTVIYHKHWVVLLGQVWQPVGLFLILFFWLITRIVIIASSAELTFLKLKADGGFIPDTPVLVLPVLMLPCVLWAIWQYVDWKNDIFMVTPDEIIDIDKKPLGTEERRAAQLDNILSTEYKRVGLVGNIFNFGTVHIAVGGSKLEFQDVMDPAGVQADINRRRMARLAKKSEETANVERERMATWIAAYHQNQGEFNAPIPIPTEDETNETREADEIQNPGEDLADQSE
jgi:hypothetical protein